MTNDNSPIDLLHDGMREFQEHYKEMVRSLRRETVTRPLDPAAEKLKPAERKARAAQFLSDPVALESAVDEQKARFKLPEGTVPRRVAEYILESLRETE